MPAPVPIQIRYDDAGMLGAAAAASGQGQAWNQQHAMDMQLIMQQIQAKQQASMMQQQQDAELNKLQTAHDYQMQQIQASQPAPENYYQMSNASDPSTAMKQMGLQAAKAAGVQGPELAMLETAAGNQHVNAAYFENIKDEVIKRSQTTASKSKNVAEKNAYLNSLGNTVSPDEMPFLKSLADAEEINLPQFTSKIQELRQGKASQEKQAAIEQKAIVQMGIGAFNDKINQAQAELRSLQHEDVSSQEKELQQRIHENVQGGMKFDEARAAATQTMQGSPMVEPSYWESLKAGINVMGIAGPVDAWTGAVDTSGAVPQSYKDRVTAARQGDPLGLKRRLAIQNKQAFITDLQKKRDELISSMGGGIAPAAPAAQPAASVKTMSDQELLQALR